MKRYEKEEIRQLPDKYKPLGAWRYFGYNILFSIPIVGIICLIVFACSGRNINRRSYARSFFCVFIVIGIAIGVMAILGISSGLFAQIQEMIQELLQGAGA